MPRYIDDDYDNFGYHDPLEQLADEAYDKLNQPTLWDDIPDELDDYDFDFDEDDEE